MPPKPIMTLKWCGIGRTWADLTIGDEAESTPHIRITEGFFTYQPTVKALICSDCHEAMTSGWIGNDDCIHCDKHFAYRVVLPEYASPMAGHEKIFETCEAADQYIQDQVPVELWHLIGEEPEVMEPSTDPEG